MSATLEQQIVKRIGGVSIRFFDYNKGKRNATFSQLRALDDGYGSVIDEVIIDGADEEKATENGFVCFFRLSGYVKHPGHNSWSRPIYRRETVRFIGLNTKAVFTAVIKYLDEHPEYLRQEPLQEN